MDTSQPDVSGVPPDRAEDVPAPDGAPVHGLRPGSPFDTERSAKTARRLDWLLLLLLALCLVRLWLMPLPSSFWVNEMGTAFVVQHGGAHPSLAVTPQVPQSIYYLLPRGVEALLGFSEIAYRLPSILVMAIGLFLIGRLAARLIHAEAAWLVVFGCLSLRGFNYQAADARPYGLGTCVAAAGLWFLVRWLDSGRRRDALAFIVFAALLWRVHLIFWPFYLVFVLYALVRRARGETGVGWLHAGAVFAVLGLALVPVMANALALYREAHAHVIVSPPLLADLLHALKLGLLVSCCGGALVLRRWFRWSQGTPPASWSSFTLFLGWWLFQPLCLFGFSWLTGNSVFVPRYLSLSLPGTAFVAAAAVAPLIPSTQWKRLAAVLGVGVLLFVAPWGRLWPLHHNSDWRAAAHRIDELSLGPEMPVVCPSPFIEAQSPVWRPDYPLPGFLYSHLPVYPFRGRPYLFPFKTSPEAERYAAHLAKNIFPAAGRFVIYGGDLNVVRWTDWFGRRPELAGWRYRLLPPYGDVQLALFESPAAAHE